jgi:hypothetical protein
MIERKNVLRNSLVRTSSMPVGGNPFEIRNVALEAQELGWTYGRTQTLTAVRLSADCYRLEVDRVKALQVVDSEITM